MKQAARICVNCGATKTPLWRGGPAGPKSLCNACGIRIRNQTGALLGPSNRQLKKKSKKSWKNNNSNVSMLTSDGSSSNNGEGNNKKGDSPRKGPKSPVFVPKEEVLNEVEAALLLMAMAYDTPF